MKPLDYFNAKAAAQEVAMQRSQRGGQPSGLGQFAIDLMGDLCGAAVIDLIGSVLEVIVTAVASIL